MARVFLKKDVFLFNLIVLVKLVNGTLALVCQRCCRNNKITY